MNWDPSLLVFGFSAAAGMFGVVFWVGYSLTQTNPPIFRREEKEKEEDIDIAVSPRKAA